MMNIKIALLGVATVGAVVALIIVATGGGDDRRAREPSRRVSAERLTSPSEPEGEAGVGEHEFTERPEAKEAKAAPVAAPRTPAVAPPVETPPPETRRRVQFARPGEPPPAMQELSNAYDAWMKSEENRFAKPVSYGLDCGPPVCMLGAKYDSTEDARFFDRSEIFLKRPELGHLISFPHRFAERESRAWFFYNPYEPGTAEHHEFNVAAIARIKEQLKELPEYYPVPRPGY